MPKINEIVVDTVFVGVYDSSMVVSKSKEKSDQLIIIQDHKKKVDSPFYESPLFISFVFPFIVSILTLFIVRRINKKKDDLDVAQIEQEIKSAKQALKDEQSRLELLNKEHLLKVQEIEKNYQIEYTKINEERNRHQLEIAKFKHSQLLELKKTFKGVMTILTSIKNSIDLIQGFEIEGDDYETHCTTQIITKHREIILNLRDIQANTLFLYSELDELFEEAIGGIIILMNRINRDRSLGIDVDAPDYEYRHNEQSKAIITYLENIVEKMREMTNSITEP